MSIRTTAAVKKLPLAADAMTSQDIAIHIRALCALVGKDASAICGVTADQRDYSCYIAVNPHGICSERDRASFYAQTWADVLKQAWDWAATYGTIRREGVIRRMALDIIDLTDSEGACSAMALRRRSHSDADIRQLHRDACSRATEMSGNAPFAVTGVPL